MSKAARNVRAALVLVVIAGLFLGGCGKRYQPMETPSASDNTEMSEDAAEIEIDQEQSGEGWGEKPDSGADGADHSGAGNADGQSGEGQGKDGMGDAAETKPQETEPPLIYEDPPQIDSEFHQATKKEWNNGWYKNTDAEDPDHQWRYINELGEAARGGWEWIDTDGDQIAESFYFSDDGYLVRNADADGAVSGPNGCRTENGVTEQLDLSAVNGWNRINAMEGYFMNGWKYRSLITPDDVYVDSRGAAVRKSNIDEGRMAAESASGIIVAVSKSTHFLEVWQNGVRTHAYVITYGSAEGDKEREGDRRTPEGTFYVCAKNPASEYTRGLILNYPTNEDAERGLAGGLINQTEYDDIIAANSNGDTPSFDTALGGDIEIHGARDYENNSAGCIELTDEEMIELYELVPLGTRVYVLP